jgi:serine phosphatase RsbU (regulator of sigma subunit)
METATASTLLIVGKGRAWEMPLSAAGMILGRHPSCDVALESHDVSRKHARLFQDPFGRWIVEDLNSRNGVWVRGQRVAISAVRPGERFRVGPFQLNVTGDLCEQIGSDVSSHPAESVLIEGTAYEILPAREVPLARMRQLSDIVDRLVEVPSVEELYGEACELLARDSETVAAVVRLPPSGALPASPEVLACRWGGGSAPVDRAHLHLSRRVLEAVRASGQPVLASQRPAEGAHQMGLTFVDGGPPRSVLCASLADRGKVLDAIYLDVPADQGGEELLDFLRAVAQQIRSTRRALLLARARAEQQQLDRELELAQQIQRSLMSVGALRLPGVEVFGHYQPAMWVGGDYCDVWALPDGRVALAIGDVSGKGLSAALVMAQLQAALKATMSFSNDPADIMHRVNELLLKNQADGTFVTFFFGLFGPADGRLEYINAGHPPPLTILPDGRAVEFQEPDATPLGVVTQGFQARTAVIPEGAAVVIFTDGISESAAPGAEGSQLGSAGLLAALRGTPLSSAEELAERVVRIAAEHRQTRPQHDDVTVLALIRRALTAAAGSAVP